MRLTLFMAKKIKPGDKMKNETPKFNDVKYGKGHIVAVSQNVWRMLDGTTTTNHQVAMNAAVAMNKLLGGETKPARRMSGTTRSDLV